MGATCSPSGDDGTILLGRYMMEESRCRFGIAESEAVLMALSFATMAAGVTSSVGGLVHTEMSRDVEGNIFNSNLALN